MLAAGRSPVFPLCAIIVSVAAFEVLVAQPPSILTVKLNKIYCNLNGEFGIEICSNVKYIGTQTSYSEFYIENVETIQNN